MDLDLTGRTAIVTGAGRGNGRAIARELAALGASIVVNDLEESVAESTAEAISEVGGTAIGIGADVTDHAEVTAMVESAHLEFGSIDILVNNAGVGDAGPFTDPEYDDDFRRNIEVHIFGAIHCTRAVLEDMREAGYGKVVNITSIHTKNGVGMSPQYDVGKFGLLGLTKSLALELGREGIRINAVAPGWVNTRMTEPFTKAVREQIEAANPLGRFAEPDEIADAVAFLSSPASDYINGHELRVDGGQVPIESWRLDDR